MKKQTIYTQFIWVIGFILYFSLLSFAITVSPGGTHYVGDNLAFTPTNADFGKVSSATWDFGDGTTQNVTYGLDTVYHSYNTPGIYTVTVEGHYISTATPIIETATVIIEPKPDNRSISVSPLPVIVGQATTFSAVNFVTPENIRWEMGDGTVLRTASVSTGSRTNRTIRNYNREMENRRLSAKYFKSRFNNRLRTLPAESTPA